MGSKALQRTVLLVLAVLPLSLAMASNPHTVDGQDCSAWLPSAPLSERVRQARSCQGFTTAKALQLAQEFETGSNGLPKDWGYAALWYRETIKIAESLPPGSLAAARGEAARHDLARILQTGGHGLESNLAEAQRLVPVNITPGFWEFTSRAWLDGQDIALENGGLESLCLTAGDIATKPPFSMPAVAESYRSSSCRIEQVRMDALAAEIRVDCEDGYDEEWGESYGQVVTFMAKYQGEAVEFGTATTTYPVTRQSGNVTTGRSLRAC